MKRVLAIAAALSLAWAAVEIAPDLKERLAKWKPVKMPLDPTSVDARQRSMIDKLVQASYQIDDVYWRQSDPEGLELVKNTTDPDLRRFLIING